MGTLIDQTRVMPAPPHDLLRAASLFLDFDGTLVELASRPDAVRVDARLRALLPRLARLLDGRLAIVSGRSAAEISGFFPDVPLSISGSHGLELHWAGDRPAAVAPAPWIARAAAQAEALRAQHPGIVIETKAKGIALHYRQAPEAAAACRALAEAIAGPGRHLQPGKMVIEVHAGGGDKGTALATFMADPRMAGTRPIFIGDDLTDEPAFAAAVALGGAGILVGAVRESAATCRLPDVPATIAWLEAAAEDCL